MTSSRKTRKPPLPAVRLTGKRYACRLPLELASRLEALFEMHPQKTRSRVLADLLGLGLAEVERVGSAAAAEPPVPRPDTNQQVYLLSGPFAEFRGLTYKHHLALERALAGDDTQASNPADEYSLGDPE